MKREKSLCTKNSKPKPGENNVGKKVARTVKIRISSVKEHWNMHVPTRALSSHILQLDTSFLISTQIILGVSSKLLHAEIIQISRGFLRLTALKSIHRVSLTRPRIVVLEIRNARQFRKAGRWTRPSNCYDLTNAACSLVEPVKSFIFAHRITSTKFLASYPLRCF